MTPTAYWMLAAAAIIGATTASLAASWWISRLRAEVAGLTTDLTNARTWHQEALAAATRQHDTEQAEWQRDLADAHLGVRDEYQRAEELREQLDAATMVEAGLRGRIADLENTIADYAHAWGDVPRAWRADVNDLDEDAQDDVWAPKLHPAPVLVGLLADAHEGRAPRLPEEPPGWDAAVHESDTQWFARFKVPERKTTPVQPVRGIRSKHKRKAVTR